MEVARKTTGEPTDAPLIAGVTSHVPAQGDAQTVKRVEIFASIEAAERQWRSLETQFFTSVHLSYDWCRNWLEATGTEPVVVLLHFTGGGRIMLPLEIISQGGAKVGRYIGTSYSNLNFGLFSPDNMQFSPPLLSAALSEAGLNLDLLALYRTPESWRGVDNPLMPLDRVVSNNQAFQMTLDGGFDKALSRINGKKRRKKHRLGERTLEELGGYEIVHGDDPETALRLLKAFFVQKAARFDKQGKLDVFAKPDVQDFFRRLVVTKTEENVPLLRLSAVQLTDGRYGAISGVTRKNGHLICQFGSIDEEMAGELSIGEFLFYRLIEDACANGQMMFDFGIGDEAYKRSWCDQITTQYDCYLPLTMKGRAVGATLRAIASTKQAIKANPRLDKIARAIQRRIS
jgi:CelD/BcsL family acetyltransferase involved in cellulose biosynthesis